MVLGGEAPPKIFAVGFLFAFFLADRQKRPITIGVTNGGRQCGGHDVNAMALARRLQPKVRSERGRGGVAGVGAAARGPFRRLVRQQRRATAGSVAILSRVQPRGAIVLD